jgi:hypothetical protein
MINFIAKLLVSAFCAISILGTAHGIVLLLNIIGATTGYYLVVGLLLFIIVLTQSRNVTKDDVRTLH